MVRFRGADGTSLAGSGAAGIPETAEGQGAPVTFAPADVTTACSSRATSGASPGGGRRRC
jgi:hypothetical protein